MGKYAKGLQNRVSIRGPEFGMCVMCSKQAKLSKDHIPPKGCTVTSDKVLQQFPDSMFDPKIHRKQIIQGGVTFQTICSPCNNWLGKEFDSALIDFTNTLNNDLDANAGKKIYFSASIKPHRVARSIIGHMLAAHAIKEVSEGITVLGANDELRSYLMDAAVQFPSNWKLLVWPYLSRCDVIMKHFTIFDTMVPDTNKMAYGHIIKFRPLGFWLVKDLPHRWKLDPRMINIAPYFEHHLDEERQVMFDFFNRPHELLPETPVDSQMAALSDTQVSYSRLRHGK